LRAAVCRAFGEPLVVDDLHLAEPQQAEVVVTLGACAICHSDISQAEGAWPHPLPAVFGHEAAGTIAACGPDVDGLNPGDRVVVTLVRSCGTCFQCTRGAPSLCETSFRLDAEPGLFAADGSPVVQGLKTAAFAEQVLVHRSQVVPYTQDVAFETAALLGCAVITGVGAATTTVPVEPGQSVVVVGAGGVGLNVIQGAALNGASPLVAIDIAGPKLESARTFGATHALDAGGDVEGGVRELTDGRGADVVFVATGAGRAVEQGIALTRRGGATVIVGMPPGDVVSSFDAAWLAGDARRIVGCKMGSTEIRRDIPRLLDLHAAGRIKLEELVSARYPLEQVNEAIATVNRGSALRNVISFS
jgi:Zn-dependent alcohol dehydrogenase